jgi:hypothetical protein
MAELGWTAGRVRGLALRATWRKGRYQLQLPSRTRGHTPSVGPASRRDLLRTSPENAARRRPRRAASIRFPVLRRQAGRRWLRRYARLIAARSISRRGPHPGPGWPTCNRRVTAVAHPPPVAIRSGPPCVSRLRGSTLQYAADQFSVAKSLVPQEGFEPPTPSLRMMAALRRLIELPHTRPALPLPGRPRPQ